MPSLSVPKIKSINSLPKLKDRSCEFLGRFTCNLFQSHLPDRNAPPVGNVLERRTVDSRQISTISSLVDRDNRSATHDGGASVHDHQKENFGLYALKHNRSSASKRGSVHRQSTGSRTFVENQNHEHFQPCRASSIDSAGSRHTVGHDEDGYCEIELSDESGSDVIQMSRSVNSKPNIKATTKQKDGEKSEKSVQSAPISSTSGSVPPVPPKRAKSKLRLRKSQPQTQKLFVPTEIADDGKEFVERSLHSQRNKFTTEKRSSAMQTTSECDLHSVKHVDGPVQPKKEQLMQNDEYDQINVTKNKSELYRIAGHTRAMTNATVEKYPQTNPSLRQIEATRRQLQRHNQSSVKSVDIFKSTNESNAFDGFDEALQIAPVVSVDRYSEASTYADENKNRNQLKRGSRVTIRDMNTRERASVDDGPESGQDSNANAQQSKTWHISTDSNELTVYSNDKQSGDFDEEIIV